MAIQLVGVEGSLSLCEVEVFTNDEFSPERCAAPNLSADTVLATFSRNCYEFHVTRGENFDSARKICKSHGGDLVNSFRGPTQDYILSELDRRKPDLRTQLVWIGAQKEPGITSRTWKWVNGMLLIVPDNIISLSLGTLPQLCQTHNRIVNCFPTDRFSISLLWQISIL